MKKRISILLTTLAVMLICAAPAFASEPIYLEINGTIVTPAAAPVIENGTTLVPIRIISQNLGCKVDWDASTQGISITKDDKVINLKIGETSATVNGENQSLSVAPKIIDSTTMVPIRFISQNLDAYVNWDADSRTVQVSKTNNFTKPDVPATSTTPTKPAAATTGEKNALAKANSYLNFSAFSYKSLIDQLEYEGFTASEAKYGADNCGANWNEQALRKAKNYLDFSAFSYSGLVGQLEYEEFTHEQAVYGVDNCGANWNEQAAKKAESYLEFSAFSRQGLIDQLKYEGFTAEQAEYGVKAVGY